VDYSENGASAVPHHLICPFELGSSPLLTYKPEKSYAVVRSATALPVITGLRRALEAALNPACNQKSDATSVKRKGAVMYRSHRLQAAVAF
jgi:hypothetical protein